MNMKRMRGRNHRSGGGSGGGGGGGFRNQQNGIPLNRNHVFDSSGPEMRVRGTAQQLYDKYSQLARDAASSNDRVLGESYYQHAEHYFRILSAINASQGLPPPGQTGTQNGEQRAQNPGEYQRQQTPEGETGENRDPRQENRDPRQENRDPRQENRDPRQENREYRDNRQGENRQERRFEQRPRQEFQPRDRQERHERPNRFSTPIADTPIDISSALEAELRAAANKEPAGLGDQPEVKAETVTVEPRAIPIRAAAPPASAPELTLTEPATAAPKRRGRPPRPKTEDPAKTE